MYTLANRFAAVVVVTAAAVAALRKKKLMARIAIKLNDSFRLL